MVCALLLTILPCADQMIQVQPGYDPDKDIYKILKFMKTEPEDAEARKRREWDDDWSGYGLRPAVDFSLGEKIYPSPALSYYHYYAYAHVMD